MEKLGIVLELSETEGHRSNVAVASLGQQGRLGRRAGRGFERAEQNGAESERDSREQRQGDRQQRRQKDPVSQQAGFAARRRRRTTDTADSVGHLGCGRPRDDGVQDRRHEQQHQSGAHGQHELQYLKDRISTCQLWFTIICILDRLLFTKVI